MADNSLQMDFPNEVCSTVIKTGFHAIKQKILIEKEPDEVEQSSQEY